MKTTVTHNAENERIKRRYFAYLKEAKRYSEASVDSVAAALHRFETYNKFRAFKAFHIEQAVAFKRHLAEELSNRSGKPLSKSTLRSTLVALKNFFHWLAGQPGFRSRLSYADAEYFNLSEKDTRIARARREQPVPTLDQILHTIHSMPASNEIECRDRALVAFILLTGARDRAVASLKLKHIDLNQACVVQDARDVQTKFSKTFTTWFFPVGDEVRQIVVEWVSYLYNEKLWGPDDPLFPATRVALNAERQFSAAGLDRRHWRDAGPIRKVFRTAFASANFPYFNPHSFRNTLAALGERLCRSPEEFKAWSQNLGHDRVMTTFSSYGEVSARRQAELIRGLGQEEVPNDLSLKKLAAQLAEIARRGR